MTERLISEKVEGYLGPVAIAQFVEAGWLLQWPLMLTRAGKMAFSNGYGFWDGTRQQLPYSTEPSPRGAAYWEGRRGRP